VIEAYALYARSQTDQKPSDAEILRAGRAGRRDPCARAIAALAFDDASWDVARQRAVMSRAVSSVDMRRRAAARELLIRSALDLPPTADQRRPGRRRHRGRQRSPRPG